MDTVIKGGLVYDGLGAPPRRADVGLREGRVAAIEPGLAERHPHASIRDAGGLMVCPGLIDIHTHYDLEVEVSPGLPESVRHGVTSVIMGNCSLSATIGTPQNLADIFQRVETLSPVLIRKWLESGRAMGSPEEYFAHLGELPLGPNVAPLLGHSALRAHVMGLERSLTAHATADELSRMEALAERALTAGCIGISIDMVPWHMMSGAMKGRTIPSQHASFKEYRMLANVCRRTGKVMQATPNPQRAASVLFILWMALGLFRKPLRLTVLSALDIAVAPRLWRAFGPILFLLNKVLRCNVRFQTLTEPFTVYADGPITPVFEEFRSGVALNDGDTPEERRALWRRPGFRDEFRRDWLGGPRKTFHCDLEAMTIARCPDASLEGLTIAAAARARGTEPVEFFMDLLETHDTELRWVATGANERPGPRRALMAHEHIFPGFTDAGAHVRNLGYYDGALSLLKQAAATGFMSMERAVSRVTGEPARWFGLDTGVLKPGAKADITLIDPKGLTEPLSGQIEISDPLLDGSIRMVKRASGNIVAAVYVGGRQVVERGEPLPILGRERLGAALKSQHQAEDPLRNAISSTVVDHPFTSYWDIFVLKHQNPWNVAFHALGVVIFYGLAVAALVTGRYWLLFLLPSSQIVGLVGHRLFERSHIDKRDAVFSTRASRALNIMFLRLVTGRYWRDVRKNQEALRAYQSRA